MTNTAVIGRGLVFAVLLVAGLAKLASVATYGGDWATLMMSVIQALLEIYLGVLYASRWQPGIMRRVMLVVFGVFIAYNLYLFVQGVSSCGCYGSIRVAPIYSVGLNIGLLILVFFIPATSKIPFELSPLSWGALVSATIIALVILTFPNWVINMRTEVVLTPLLLEAEYGFDGYEHRVPITLTNLANRQIKIVGWSCNSSSAELHDFKITVLESGQSHTFNLLWGKEPLNEEEGNELIEGLLQYRSRATLEALKEIRVLSFLNQHGDECARCLLQEKLAESVVDLVVNAQ